MLGVLNANQEVKEKIEEISNKGKWNSTSTEKNWIMKYNYQSNILSKCHKPELMGFKKDIEKYLLVKIPHLTNPYVIGKFNLLKNSGMLHDDQDPHLDYPPRVIK